MKRFSIFGMSLLLCLCVGCGSSAGKTSADETTSAQAVTTESTAESKAPYGYTKMMIEQNVDPKDHIPDSWTLEATEDSGIPGNFRSVYSDFETDKVNDDMDPDYVPSTEGLTATKMSGSAEFSEGQLEGLKSEIGKYHDGKICIVDLRQESHLLVNGKSISRHGAKNWGNLGKNLEEVTADENKLSEEILGTTIEVTSGRGEDKKTQTMDVTDVKTEKELAESNGLEYFRLPCTDQVSATGEEIDNFITFVKGLDDDTWLHFHCMAGQGRTTFFMALYDMLRNPEVSLEDIAYRQYKLGGAYVLATSEDENSYDNEKAETMKLVYQYIQENYKTDYEVSFCEWSEGR